MHLSHLVENVLDVARMDKRGVKLVRAPVDPEELVRTLVSSYESWLTSKGFSVDVEIDSGIGEQMWDREAMSRALLNLIDNAVKYSEDDRHLVVRLRDHAKHVEIAVQDHGIGLRSSDLARIFEPYYRAQFSDTQTRRGAGLGLTLVQQIIRAHGGTIEVDSSPGKGSTFRFLLPKPAEPDRHETRMLQPPGRRFASDSGETK
jgi:signal transduction histidine kinase